VVFSIFYKVSLPIFLLGVALPLLPPLLDVYDQWRSAKQAGADRLSMADSIERAIRGNADHLLSANDLLVWQERLYGLRHASPQVPDLIYRRAREHNEHAMVSAAKELAAATRREVH
jgi:SMODS-associating 4TM effector domain